MMDVQRALTASSQAKSSVDLSDCQSQMYATAVVQGQNPSGSSRIINPKYRLIVGAAIAGTGLATAAVLAPWEAVRIIGMTVLTGVGYGVANDMIACRDCIEYFTVGHVYDGRRFEKRPLNTLNPNLNALVWGAIATWHVCAVAGTFFALVARVPFPGMALKVTAAQLAPYLAISAGIALLVSHARSRSAQKVATDRFEYKYSGVPMYLQSGWEACSVRNRTGYASIGIGGAILSIGMIAARAGLLGV